MDYKSAINYIEVKNKLGSVPGLDNVKELLRRLGNPQDKCKCLHIAGTNGKGSVFSFVQEILIEAGYSVGRYVSPTIFCYLERFQINKVNMSEDDFARMLTIVAEQVDSMTADGLNSPTSFEIETAIAFLYFERMQVDYVLIECGMGGELDATNVIECPVVTAFASIGMDHMQILGDTLEKIAMQKAGIIKPGSICVSAPQDKEAEAVIADRCKMLGNELIFVDEDGINIQSMDIDRTVFNYKGNSYEITLLGDHQVINAATAIEVSRCIVGISEENIRQGLAKTVWSGRLTKMSDSPLMFVDGAHNEPAWTMLRKAVNKYFTNRRIIYIIGVLGDKEYTRLVDIFADTMSYVVAITPDSPRALDKDVLAGLLRDRGIARVETADTSDEAMKLAFMSADTSDVILVCGSLSFISDYLDYDRICNIYSKVKPDKNTN